MESFILELNKLFFRTMHSSALRVLECIAWGRSATSDCEASPVETGDIKTGDKETRESKISLLRGLDTFHLLKIEHKESWALVM